MVYIVQISYPHIRNFRFDLIKSPIGDEWCTESTFTIESELFLKFNARKGYLAQHRY